MNRHARMSTGPEHCICSSTAPRAALASASRAAYTKSARTHPDEQPSFRYPDTMSPESDNQEAASRIWSVSELNRMIRGLLEQSFYPFWLRGEISNLTIHRSGHVYFSVKDARSQISAVFFRGARLARELNLRNGVEVDIRGRLGVYEPRGIYQIVVQQLKPRGTGRLQQRFEELKRRLRAEGLFDEDRKRPVPAVPRCVGIVTSPDGAALRDMLQILGRRFASMHIRIYPAAVQGDAAAVQVADGIDFFNRTDACDVIVVTRGGGSLEDLWPFNEEIVAHAVARSAIPVISAVGHEVDFTICDFAADLRVPTPSAAAERVTARKEELVEKVRILQTRLQDRMKLKIGDLHRRTERAAGHPVFQQPRHLVEMYQQRVDELYARLARSMEYQRQRSRRRLDQAVATLNAVSPGRVLSRGYAVLLHERTGKAVTKPDEAPPGDRMRAVLASGDLEVESRGPAASAEATAPDRSPAEHS